MKASIEWNKRNRESRDTEWSYCEWGGSGDVRGEERGRQEMCVFFSSRRRHTSYWRDWSSDVCSSDLGLLGPRLGLLGPRFGLLDVPPGLIGAPLGPRGAPLVEGEHGVEEVHVVVRGHPREVPSGLLREPLLAGQLPRHLRGAPGLGAEVADHGVEEVLDLPGAHLLGHHGVVGCCPIRCHQGIGELLGRLVYPLLLLVVHSALPPVLRALTGRWYPSRPPARGTPRRKPPACGPSPR